MRKLIALGVALVACTKQPEPEHTPPPAVKTLATATPCAPDRQAADVPLGAKAIAITAARDRACALLEDRTVMCWGNDAPEHVGEMPYAERAVPPERIRKLTDVVELVIANYSGCARRAAGNLACWGQEPLFKSRQVVKPSKVLTTGTLALGLGHTCVAHDGGAWCGGSLVPFGSFPGWSRVPGASGVSQVATGGGFGCAIATGGNVVCWGEHFNKYEAPIRAVPVPALGKATALALSDWDACALHPNGAVTCVREAESDTLVAIAIDNLRDAKKLALDGRIGCAVRANGKLACWDGLEGTSSARDPAIAKDVPGLADVKDVALGDGFACALRTDGNVRCWGNNGARQLGVDTLLESRAPLAVCGLDHVTRVATGYGHTCALRDTGDVYCWGDNHAGELGSGTKPSAVPVRVPGAHDIVDVVAHRQTTCSLDRAGHATCWGDNPLSATVHPNDFVVPTTPVTAIALDGWGLCAITRARTVTCNGKPVPGITNAGHLAGGDFMCTDTDGPRGRRVVCWNTGFERADGIRVPDHPSVTTTELVDLVTCEARLCGVTANRRVFCHDARRVDNPAACTPWDPEKLDQLPVMHVGMSPTCTVQPSGLVTCRGDNRSGQLGTGMFGYLQAP